MKKSFLLFSSVLALFFASCSDDKDNSSSISSDEVLIKMDDKIDVDRISAGQALTFNLDVVENLSISKYVWKVNREEVVSPATKSNVVTESFTFIPEQQGNYSVSVDCYLENGAVHTVAFPSFQVYGKYRFGTFVLNEGNMTSETGSFVYISPFGEVVDSAYYKVNNKFLGNVTQDLFITKEGLMYIVAQNGKTSAVGGEFDSEGILVVANAETLKNTRSYNDELKELSWPSHVAVIDDNVFIRDNAGVYCFNESTKQLDFVKGTKGALKNRMAVVDDYVFVPKQKAIAILKADKDSIVGEIAFDATVTAVIKSSDNNLWVSTNGSPAQIHKVNAKEAKIIASHDINESKVGAGWGGTPAISAKGDSIYFSNAGTKIYRHIFSANKTEFMVDTKTLVTEDAGMVYNNLGVHPVTGEVYLNTIKGYGWDYLKNNISVFNFSKAEPKLAANYKHHTKFPAGIFFPDYYLK